MRYHLEGFDWHIKNVSWFDAADDDEAILLAKQEIARACHRCHGRQPFNILYLVRGAALDRLVLRLFYRLGTNNPEYIGEALVGQLPREATQVKLSDYLVPPGPKQTPKRGESAELGLDVP